MRGDKAATVSNDCGKIYVLMRKDAYTSIFVLKLFPHPFRFDSLGLLIYADDLFPESSSVAESVGARVGKIRCKSTTSSGNAEPSAR